MGLIPSLSQSPDLPSKIADKFLLLLNVVATITKENDDNKASHNIDELCNVFIKSI